MFDGIIARSLDAKHPPLVVFVFIQNFRVAHASFGIVPSIHPFVRLASLARLGGRPTPRVLNLQPTAVHVPLQTLTRHRPATAITAREEKSL